VDPQSEALVEQMGTGVNKGESWALALAEERGALLLVDDRQARRVARERDILHIGTAGIVVKAGRDGVIPTDEVEPMLRRLQADGMRLTNALIRQILGSLTPRGAP
jgi:predicted nucleic acid-binding protein